MVQMSNFYLRSVRKILLENDPAPIQGTAKAILLRPRPPSTTRGPWPPLLDHRDPRKAIRTKTVGGLQNCIPSRALGPFCQQLVLAKGTQNRFQRAQVLKRVVRFSKDSNVIAIYQADTLLDLLVEHKLHEALKSAGNSLIERKLGRGGHRLQGGRVRRQRSDRSRRAAHTFAVAVPSGRKGGAERVR